MASSRSPFRMGNGFLSTSKYSLYLLIVTIAIHRLIKFINHVEPDGLMRAPEYIASRGFIPETHFVTTPDGYIVALHRIRNPLDQMDGDQERGGRRRFAQRKPLLLNHCLLCSSVDWMYNSPGGGLDEDTPTPEVLRRRYTDILQSILAESGLRLEELLTREGQIRWPLPATDGNNFAFELAKYGFDVWLMNARGNLYSRNHTHLDPDRDRSYWRFGMDELIEYDLPAIIEHIQTETGQPEVGYIGFSQGGNAALGLLSERPHYADILRPLVLISPAFLAAHLRAPIHLMLAVMKPFLHWWGGEFLNTHGYLSPLVDIFCVPAVTHPLCANGIFLFAGFDPLTNNQSRVGIYTKQTPAGTSAWNIVHYTQLIQSRDPLRKFDFGLVGNLQKYGEATPPAYNLSRVHSRDLFLAYGLNDWLADHRDILTVRVLLGTPPRVTYEIPYDDWNHLDAIRSQNASNLLLTQVMAYLLSYE